MYGLPSASENRSCTRVLPSGDPRAQGVYPERPDSSLPQQYAEGLVSQGKAAEIAGLSRLEFLDELAKRKVPVIQMTVEELKAELAGE
jgi:hypothetical protein